jgi:DUF4097 and DUF4098 domain-containing protein YvlB
MAASVRDQKRIALTGTPNVTVRTFHGAVEVRAWDRNEILVDMEKWASTNEDARAMVVDASEDAGNVLIEAKDLRERSNDSLLFGWTSPRVNLTITVPREATVDARTEDGTIDVRSVQGRIELRTGDGPIRLDEVGGDIHVSTKDGAVTGCDVQGTVAVTTGDGSIKMSGRFEGLSAHTGDGSMAIDALPGSAMKRAWTITSGDGSVLVRLPEDFDADVEAHTGDGAISVSGVKVLTGNGDEDRHNVRGRIGKGGDVLTVRTGDGSINLVAR